MKKIIASSVLATAALLPNFTYAEETTYPASMTTDSAVEIRKGTTPDDQVVTTLPDGESVVVVDEFTNSSGELWYKVESDGISGWGLSTGFQEASASLVGQDAVSTGSNVNVRRGASTSYEVIGKLTLGQKVKVIDQHENSQGELWYRISFNGQQGWTIGAYLEADSDQGAPSTSEPSIIKKAVQVDSASVRRGASSEYLAVASLNKGQEVKIIGEHENSKGELWYRVDLDYIIGWVNSSAFEAPAYPVTTKVVQIDNSNVRRGASTEYSTVATLDKNQEVKIIGEHENSKGELWYRVDLGYIIGWVNSSAFEAPAYPVTTKVVQIDNSAVRRGASTEYTTVATLDKNQEIKIIGEHKNSIGELWYRVDLGYIIGWVNSSIFEAPAYPVTTKVVQIDKSNVRRGASAEYTTVATLDKNQEVKIIGEHKNSIGELWYRVDLGYIIGWVNSSAFIYAVTTKVVQIDNSAVRRGASAEYTTVATLNKNQEVKITGEHKNSKGELWYRADLGYIIGWVNSTAFIAPEYTIKTVQVDHAVVRRGADLSYQTVASLEKLQQVKIIDEFTNSKGELWYRADLGHLLGWVDSSAFKKPEPGAISLTGTYYVGNRNTNLHSGATYDYRVVEKLNITSKVTVLSGFINQSMETWARVSTTSGNIGWVPFKDLVASTAELKYVYALNNAALRRGASTTYQITASLKADEPLLILNKLNGWLNVETNTGLRGWVLESQTSPVSLKRLSSPSTYTEGTASYLVWKKPTDFDFTYTTLSANRLKLTQGITDADLPSFKVKGIKSIETVQSSSTQKSVILTFEPGYTFTIRDYSDKVSIKVMPTGLLGKKIVIDAGHGGKDTGAIGPTGLLEKDVNLATAFLLKTELERSGAIVNLTRSTDIFLELAERTAIANSSNYDAFISIHADSFSSTSRGSTTFFNSTVNFNGPKSEELADSVQKYMVSSLGTYNRGVKEQEFYVNRMNQLPSILVELAFISNPNEESLLRSTAFRQKAAEGIRKGFQDYYSNF
ncbi:SH3 domain-containing protein [Cytobacillus oceanisediminis]|uniref:SH3 domain-containing protein n=1 Tax=Cytobacillus oceanisediminis TaxID=665099 RepID=UPI001C221F94|nr:SH3 domain-containing protein [Cytobacillus oceanisediminis]MBU8771515.1 SH3 domain-containing protein [Cytobacillus oceanisediminis]